MLDREHGWKPSHVVYCSSITNSRFLFLNFAGDRYCQVFRIKRLRRKQVSLWRLRLFKSRPWVFILLPLLLLCVSLKSQSGITSCVLGCSKPRHWLKWHKAQAVTSEDLYWSIDPSKQLPPLHTLYDEDLAFQLVLGCIWKAARMGGKMISKQIPNNRGGQGECV